MIRRIRTLCWLSLFGILAIQSALAETPRKARENGSPAAQEVAPVSVSAVRTVGGWKLVESSNFRCWSQLPDDDAIRLTQSCELWRSRIRETWLTRPEQRTWTPKCEVYVHPTIGAYTRTLRRPGDTSVGSTMMNFDQGRPVLRRIDLRADAADWSNAALPHELTHVVLGDRFGGRALPRWADEGIAMLSESADKHRVRLENLQDLVTSSRTMAIFDVVTTARLPAPHQRDAFYGQSLGLCSLLVRKRSAARFADFVEDAITSNVELALKKNYSIDGLAALQQEWNEWVRDPETLSFVSLSIQTGNSAKVAATQEP